MTDGLEELLAGKDADIRIAQAVEKAMEKGYAKMFQDLHQVIMDLWKGTGQLLAERPAGVLEGYDTGVLAELALKAVEERIAKEGFKVISRSGAFTNIRIDGSYTPLKSEEDEFRFYYALDLIGGKLQDDSTIDIVTTFASNQHRVQIPVQILDAGVRHFLFPPLLSGPWSNTYLTADLLGQSPVNNAMQVRLNHVSFKIKR